MAQNHSFDIVSDIDLQEADNAVNQALKEIQQRYDLKDSHTEFVLDKKKKIFLSIQRTIILLKQVLIFSRLSLSGEEFLLKL